MKYNDAMVPNENGLFTVDQVAVLASKRGCKTRVVDDYGCEIRRGEKEVKIMATDRGLWSPVNVFRACRQAAGQPSYEIDYAKIKIKDSRDPNEIGNAKFDGTVVRILDERRIATIIGADGVRPYLSRPSQYLVNEDMKTITRPPSGAWQREPSPDQRRVPAGGWTYPMYRIITGRYIKTAAHCPVYRRAMRALADAGLVRALIGSMRGIGSGPVVIYWQPLAYLPLPAPKLADVDDEAMALLA